MSEELEERVRALEDRVALLEARALSVPKASSGEAPSGSASTTDTSSSPSSSSKGRSRSIVALALTNKRFAPSNPTAGSYQDHIWMDFTLTLAADSPPTRAIKGTLTFCDLFGEPQFLIGYSVTDPLKPGIPHKVKGVGFVYNKFMDDHKWLMHQAAQDMIVYFDVSQIIFRDGSTEAFD